MKNIWNDSYQFPSHKVTRIDIFAVSTDVTVVLSSVKLLSNVASIILYYSLSSYQQSFNAFQYLVRPTFYFLVASLWDAS